MCPNIMAFQMITLHHGIFVEWSRNILPTPTFCIQTPKEILSFAMNFATRFMQVLVNCENQKLVVKTYYKSQDFF